MITLINPPGLKTFSGLQMHTPNPPLGLAYGAAAVREAGFPYRVIDGTGEALDAVSPYPDRRDFMVQGLTFGEIVERIPSDSDVIGISCMFSTLWPLTRTLRARPRAVPPGAAGARRRARHRGARARPAREPVRRGGAGRGRGDARG